MKDESTYLERLVEFLNVVDPRSLLYTQKQLDDALKLLANPSSAKSKQELDEALKIKQAIINPGTNEPIPIMLRMSSFVPMNVPIILGMLTSTSYAGTIFWQVVNQSYNSALNYANRSGSNVSTEQIIQSYALAVGKFFFFLFYCYYY